MLGSGSSAGSASSAQTSKALEARAESLAVLLRENNQRDAAELLPQSQPKGHYFPVTACPPDVYFIVSFIRDRQT